MYFYLNFTFGLNIKKQVKISKLNSSKLKRKKKLMTTQNIKIALLSPLYKFSPPSLLKSQLTNFSFYIIEHFYFFFYKLTL